MYALSPSTPKASYWRGVGKRYSKFWKSVVFTAIRINEQRMFHIYGEDSTVKQSQQVVNIKIRGSYCSVDEAAPFSADPCIQRGYHNRFYGILQGPRLLRSAQGRSFDRLGVQNVSSRSAIYRRLENAMKSLMNINIIEKRKSPRARLFWILS